MNKLNYNLAKDLLPYKYYDKKNQLFISEKTIGFCIEVNPISGLEDNQVDYINNIYREFLNKNEVVQTIFFPSDNKYNHINKWLGQHTASNVDRDFFLRRAEYILNLKNCFDFKIFISFSIPFSEKTAKEAIDLIIDRRDQFTKYLISASFYIKHLDINIFLEFSREFVNGFYDINDSKYNPYALLNEQIFADDLKLTEKQYLNLDFPNKNVAIKTFKVKKYPEEWHQNLNINLISGMKVAISCTYELMDYKKYQTTKKMKGDMVIRNAKTEKGFRDIFGKQSAQEWMTADLLEQEGEVPLKNSYTIILYSDQENIYNDSEKLKLFFKKQGFTIEGNDPELDIFYFLHTLPITGYEEIASFFRRGMLRTTFSNEPAILMPIQGEWKGSFKGTMLLVGEKGQIQLFSPFDNTGGNYNMTFVGKSGAGKSVCMQDCIISFLPVDSKIFVLDVGKSYERLARQVGGEYVEFTAREPISLNPFACLKQLGKEEYEDYISLLKPILQLMSSPKNGTDDLEDAELEEAAITVIKKYQEETTLDLLIEQLKAQQADHLARKLFSFSSKGVFGGFFKNNTRAINFNSDLVVIEFEHIREKVELKQVVLQMVILQITKQALLGDRKKKFFIVIDEAWELLDDPQAVNFINTLARRVRKYNGSLVTGTQSVEDFYRNPAALAAFHNSDFNIFLAQKPESVEQLKKDKRFSLTPYLESKLKSIQTIHGQYSELMICNSNWGNISTRLILDDYSKKLYSTKAEDFVKFNELIDQGISHDEALKILCNA